MRFDHDFMVILHSQGGTQFIGKTFHALMVGEVTDSFISADHIKAPWRVVTLMAIDLPYIITTAYFPPIHFSNEVQACTYNLERNEQQKPPMPRSKSQSINTLPKTLAVFKVQIYDLRKPFQTYPNDNQTQGLLIISTSLQYWLKRKIWSNTSTATSSSPWYNAHHNQPSEHNLDDSTEPYAE